MKIEEKIDTYNHNKLAHIGDVIPCPGCGILFTKETYQQVFCKNRPGTQCKDAYWNIVRGNPNPNPSEPPTIEVRSLKTHTFYIRRSGPDGLIEQPKEITIKEIVSILKDELDFWKLIIPLLEHAFNAGYGAKK